MDGSDPVRRLCAVVEAEGPVDHPYSPVADVVESASAAAGVDQIALQVLPSGLLLVLSSGVNEARVVSDLSRELRNALWRRNRRLSGAHRLRCRISFHQGLVRLTDEGFDGQAVRVARDLCGSDDLRAALLESAEHDLALILSARLLDELAYPESTGLHREQFRRVTATAQGRHVPAYVYAYGEAT
ncbi:hypothetical protein OG320_06235 [Microbispora sp. NBC_01189]|uniref:hypothetical protein n=1 Tax=Microbispora sp. NBC_01189 TaxID=2903583 RepID=UPI002E0E5C8A|nr:hypothetical protein OG320_06235 [Microbispora sp. NBC_01189]